jgi:hypothetical protein
MRVIKIRNKQTYSLPSYRRKQNVIPALLGLLSKMWIAALLLVLSKIGL